MADPIPLLQADALECRREDRILFRGLGFALHPGEVMQVEGANGSGKTTLLRMVCGLMLPDAGDIRWNGQNIRTLREEYSRQVLYLGHLNGIKNDLSGIENLRVSAALDGDAVGEVEVAEALERIGLAGFEDLPTRVLSQGQKRRVALARLLLGSAPLWVLDEPFVALDVKAVELLRTIIVEHVARGGMVILTTHQEVQLGSSQLRRLQLGGTADV